MLVRAARPTASSTFSGYRYVPAGDLGWAGRGRGRLDPSESGRRIRRERERKREREHLLARRGSSTRGRCGSVLRDGRPKSAAARTSSPQLPLAPAAPGPRGARLCTRARLCWYSQARAVVHLARYMCVHRLGTCADSGWPWVPLRRPAAVRRNARAPVRLCSPLPTCPYDLVTGSGVGSLGKGCTVRVPRRAA